MWALWRRAKSLRARPADLLEISDPIVRYMFDRAVSTLGMIIEEDIQTAGEQIDPRSDKDGKKRQRAVLLRLNKWLGTVRYREVG